MQLRSGSLLSCTSSIHTDSRWSFVIKTGGVIPLVTHILGVSATFRSPADYTRRSPVGELPLCHPHRHEHAYIDKVRGWTAPPRVGKIQSHGLGGVPAHHMWLSQRCGFWQVLSCYPAKHYCIPHLPKLMQGQFDNSQKVRSSCMNVTDGRLMGLASRPPSPPRLQLSC